MKRHSATRTSSETAAQRTQRGFELSLQQVDNDASIALQMSIPGFRSHHGVRTTFALDSLSRRLDSNLIEILQCGSKQRLARAVHATRSRMQDATHLMQPIQQEREQLGRVLLIVPAKARSKLPKHLMRKHMRDP